MSKDTRVPVKIDARLYVQLKKIADKKRQPISWFIRDILEQYLKK